MKDGARIGMAVGLGYLLGRTRKGRLALMLVGVGATGRLGKNPAALVKQGAELLGSSPEVKTLTDTVRGRLVEAGKTAAVAAVSNQVDTLTGKIEERTGALSSPPLGGQATQTDEDTEQDTAEQSGEAEQEEDQEAEQEEGNGDKAAEQRPRRPSPRRPKRPEPADDPEDEDEDEDDDGTDGRPRRPSRPSSQRPPVRRTRRREQ